MIEPGYRSKSHSGVIQNFDRRMLNFSKVFKNRTATLNSGTSIRIVPSRWYRAAWVLALILAVAHIASLTLAISFDGQWYVNLADILGTNRFPGTWDFLRGPLYPAFLKGFFWLLGRQALAVIVLNTVLGSLGIYFLCKYLVRQNRQVEAAIAVLLLSFYPTLIAYEHEVFTEVGTFAFLALIIVLAVEPAPRTRGAVALALALTAGYYYRSSLVYLAPFAALIFCVPALRNLPSPRCAGRFWRSVRKPAALALVITLLPFALAYPWNRNPNVKRRTGEAVFLFGLVQSTVLPPDDPILSPHARAVYREAIEQSRVHGRITATGLLNGSVWSVSLNTTGSSGESVLWRVIRTHPKRYFRGIVRNLRMVAGYSELMADNEHLRQIVFRPAGSKIDPGPSWFPPLGAEFNRQTTRSFISSFLQLCEPVYEWLVRLGFVVTLLGIPAALLMKDRMLLGFTLLPMLFISFHVVCLMSEDRMAMPAYPILLLNLLVIPFSVTRYLSVHRPILHRQRRERFERNEAGK